MRITIQGETIDSHFGLQGTAEQVGAAAPRWQPATETKGQARPRSWTADAPGATPALQTLERYTTATLIATMAPRPPPPKEWRDLMDQLSTSSCAHYKSYVYEHPLFVDYFRAATPLHELAQMNIGSRPARRNQTGGVETLRAIPYALAPAAARHPNRTLRAGSRHGPAHVQRWRGRPRVVRWVFAWTQSRSHLPVWLGVGFAIQEALRDGKQVRAGA